MLLPSAIQRSEDLVGMATPMVPLSPELPEPLPPQAARLMARAAPATVAINLRTTFSTLLRESRGCPCPGYLLFCAGIRTPAPVGGTPGSTAAPDGAGGPAWCRRSGRARCRACRPGPRDAHW